MFDGSIYGAARLFEDLPKREVGEGKFYSPVV